MHLRLMQMMQVDHEASKLEAAGLAPISGRAPCVNGRAAGYPCNNLDLMSFISHYDMGSKVGQGNDIWGWTDPDTGREYAIVGQFDGTAFVDVTDPERPVFKGRLPTSTVSSDWRDMKVYQNHAFIVAEARQHGVQVFDLTLLRDPNVRGVTFNTTAFLRDTGRCHNIVINEETGFAYCVGSNDVCSGGLYMIDIKDPKNPKPAGCFANDGYVHDAQCLIYRGPDAKYRGKEICFCYNEDTLTIVDVSNKAKVDIISRVGYIGAQYTHQGWLTEDQAYMLMDDELDEQYGANRGYTLTYIWDVHTLEDPHQFANYSSPTTSIDHNLYIKGNFAYLSNYASGLRVVDITNIANGNLKEHAFFDVRPEDDRVQFWGTWSNYPYFGSGNIIVNSIERGLFVVRPTQT
ncbi:hypothetical protein HK102_001527 [Quaeritorhiza haematococci]|nr:hypothetical protein HK102_001527 [Quaeritorhiza haematococci]